MRLRALLDTEALGLRLLGGDQELDRTVHGVMTTDLRDPSRYLSGGELVLTGLAWRRGPEDSEPFVRRIAAAGVAALAAGEAEVGGVPRDLVEACARHRLPLFAVDERVAFAAITEHVVRRVSSGRAGDLAAVVDRHRRLMAPGPGGGGPDAVLDLLATDLDLRGWVLSCTGRRIAGDPAGLPDGPRAALAGEELAARRTGRPVPHRAVRDGRVFALFPVPPDEPPGGRGQEAAGPLSARLLSDWLLAVEADASDWPAERLELLGGVTRLIAAERERQEAAGAVRRRLAHEVLERVVGGAAPAEVAARLRLAVPVMLPGVAETASWQVVVARLEGSSGEAAGGPVAQPLLEEVLLAAPGGPDRPGGDGRAAVAYEGEEAVALLPLAEQGAGLSAGTLLRAVGAPLARGLADTGRLTIGVSAAVRTAEGLRGALEEARHARRVAAARPGRVCAAGHEELASHVLLLPFVPDDVRRAFTARLLDPLRDYDRRHRAELVPTLEAFLECDGSWTRCAARLHLHVNTLRYRVGRIEQMTGRDLSRLEDKMDFLLALRMR